MAEYLKKDKPLKTLDLSYNRIENEGAFYLADSLRFSNTNLEKLGLKNNNIGHEGIFALLEALKSNSSINGLFIWGNQFDNQCGKVFFIIIMLFNYITY